MKRRILLSFAMASLIGGTALAQTTNNATRSTGTGLRTTDGLFTNRLGLLDTRMVPQTQGGAGALGNTTFQFVPGVGFVPQALGTGTGFNTGFNNGLNNGFVNGIDPTLNNGFVNGFDPRLNNGFNNGFGFTPGFSYGYGPTWSGPLVDVRSAWGQGSGVGIRGTGYAGTGIPTLGMNVRAAGPPGVPVGRVRVKMTTDPTIQQRVAGARQEARAEQPVDQEQVRLASKLGNVMEDRPLREGTITSLGATGAQVKVAMNGSTTTARFPMEEVFFFKAGGALATAATDPDLVGIGTKVLVPQPAAAPREAVAGSRQELSSQTVDKPAMRFKPTAKKKTKRSTR